MTAAPNSPRSVRDWFDEYSAYHRNPVNKVIHWICIPLITLSLLGLLWEIPLPPIIKDVSPWLHVATLFAATCLVFYLRLSMSIAFGMALSAGPLLLLNGLADAVMPGIVWKVSVAIFAIAWIGQLIGHHLEGRKPAFLQDVQYLLIGPAWLLRC